MKLTSRNIAIFITLLIIGGLMYYFNDIVAYVMIAWVLSLIGQPLMDFFQKYLKVGAFRAGPVTSAILTLITFLVVFSSLVMMFVPTVIQQGRNLAGIDYASLVKTLEEPINDWNNWFIEKGFISGEVKPRVTTEMAKDSLGSIKPFPFEQEDKEEVTSIIRIDSILMANGDTVTKTNIELSINLNRGDDALPKDKFQDPTAVVNATDNPFEKLQKRLFSFFNPSQIPALFSSLVGFMGNFLIAFLSILFITFFFLKEEGLFINFIKALAPSEYGQKILNAADDISRLLTRYFLGVMTQVTIITIFVSTALGLLGVKNALLIGFFAALINVIPYVGPTIGASFGIFITISSNLDMPFYSEMMPLLFMVFGVFAAMQMLDNFVLQPYIFSNSVQAHPLEIFIIILIGAKLYGVLGMVLAIPVYTVIRVIARSFLSEFKIVQALTGGIDDVT